MAVIEVSNEELNLIMQALVDYRLRGFPMGKSFYANPIRHKDRREWATLGMAVYRKLHTMTQVKEGE